MGKHRQYSDKEKAEALAILAANGGNVNRTAEQLKIPRKTLTEWVKSKPNPDVAELRQETKRELKDLIEDEIRGILKDLPNKHGEAGFVALMTGLGILVDKLQLLSGKPTERSEIVTSYSDEERVDRITGLLDTARARRDGQPARSTDD